MNEPVSIGNVMPVKDNTQSHVHLDLPTSGVAALIENGSMHVNAGSFLLFRAKPLLEHCAQILLPTRTIYPEPLILAVNTRVPLVPGDVLFSFNAPDWQSSGLTPKVHMISFYLPSVANVHSVLLLLSEASQAWNIYRVAFGAFDEHQKFKAMSQDTYAAAMSRFDRVLVSQVEGRLLATRKAKEGALAAEKNADDSGPVEKKPRVGDASLGV
jgi:hypothetical protein